MYFLIKHFIPSHGRSDASRAQTGIFQPRFQPRFQQRVFWHRKRDYENRKIYESNQISIEYVQRISGTNMSKVAISRKKNAFRSISHPTHPLNFLRKKYLLFWVLKVLFFISASVDTPKKKHEKHFKGVASVAHISFVLKMYHPNLETIFLQKLLAHFTLRLFVHNICRPPVEGFLTSMYRL